VSRANYVLIALSSQAFILSPIGCCRLVLALDSHVGDGCRGSPAGGSGFSKRTFATGYYRPTAVTWRRCRKRSFPVVTAKGRSFGLRTCCTSKHCRIGTYSSRPNTFPWAY